MRYSCMSDVTNVSRVERFFIWIYVLCIILLYFNCSACAKSDLQGVGCISYKQGSICILF